MFSGGRVEESRKGSNSKLYVCWSFCRSLSKNVVPWNIKHYYYVITCIQQEEQVELGWVVLGIYVTFINSVSVIS